MYDKEKRILFEVLALLREMPHLWDKNHAFYKNSPKRRESYEILLKKYNEFDKKASLSYIKQKVESMRASYFREHKKVTDSRGKYTYTPSLWYYSALSFLGENDKQTTAKSPERVKESNVISPPSDDENPTRELLTHIKERRESFESEPYKVIEPPATKVASREECAITAQAIGLQLRDVANHQLVIAQKLISDAIFYAKIGKLCEDSFICLNSTYGSTGST